MKKKTFYDIDHARMYLDNSVITHKGKPAYIRNVGRSYLAQFSYLDTPLGLEQDKLNSGHFDFTPILLGFVNWEGSDPRKYKGKQHYAFHVARTPSRRYKVGLYRGNAKLTYFRPYHLLPNFSGMIFDKHFVNTISGTFPQFDEALHLSNKNDSFVAFSRRFAVESGTSLIYHYFRDTPVGVIRSGGPELAEHFEYLKEVLQKDLRK